MKHASFLRILPFATTLLVFTPLHAADDDKAKKDGNKAKAEDTKKKEEVKSIFTDKNFENAVRKQVFAKRDTEEPLTAEDVRKAAETYLAPQPVTAYLRAPEDAGTAATANQ